MYWPRSLVDIYLFSWMKVKFLMWKRFAFWNRQRTMIGSRVANIKFRMCRVTKFCSFFFILLPRFPSCWPKNYCVIKQQPWIGIFWCLTWHVTKKKKKFNTCTVNCHECLFKDEKTISPVISSQTFILFIQQLISFLHNNISH